jgi:hypothetical protein
MVYLISAVVDDLSRVSGVRHDARQALKLALDYHRQGFTDVRVKTDDAEYGLQEFRFLVE